MANDRNAGRKPILNAVNFSVKIPVEGLGEIQAFKIKIPSDQVNELKAYAKKFKLDDGLDKFSTTIPIPKVSEVKQFAKTLQFKK